MYDFGGNFLTASQVGGQIAAHALVGGVIAELQGGKFGHGFFSAGVTKGFGGAFLPGGEGLSTAQVARGTVVSAIIGGTASKISGGKFANGAQTAVFQYLYNQMNLDVGDPFNNFMRRVGELFGLSDPQTVVSGQLSVQRGNIETNLNGDVALKLKHADLNAGVANVEVGTTIDLTNQQVTHAVKVSRQFGNDQANISAGLELNTQLDASVVGDVNFRDTTYSAQVTFHSQAAFMNIYKAKSAFERAFIELNTNQ